MTGKGNNGRTTVGRTEGGDIYASHNGEVYKKTGDGFQKYENGGWTNTSGGNSKSSQRPNTTAGGMDSATLDQLNRDSKARAEGATRTQDLSNYRSNMGGRSSAGSYRGGGGYSRGGGRRR